MRLLKEAVAPMVTKQVLCEGGIFAVGYMFRG